MRSGSPVSSAVSGSPDSPSGEEPGRCKFWDHGVVELDDIGQRRVTRVRKAQMFRDQSVAAPRQCHVEVHVVEQARERACDRLEV